MSHKSITVAREDFACYRKNVSVSIKRFTGLQCQARFELILMYFYMLESNTQYALLKEYVKNIEVM